MKDPKAFILKYQEVHNAHNIDQALRFFAPTFRFEMAGIWVRQGLEEQRSLEEWDQVVSSQLFFTDFRKRSGRLECQVRETSMWLNMVGINAVFYDAFMFEFTNGQISRLKAKLSPRSERDIDKAVNRVLRWALEARPDSVEEIIPRGTFIYGRTQAESWLVLLKEWQQEAAKRE